MITYPAIDPVAIHIGSLSIFWYGLMYLLSFVAGWGLLTLRLKKAPQHIGINNDINIRVAQVSDIVFYFALGVIIGGRLGYILFYGWADFIAQPVLLLQIWKGGMSFHGGLIGVLIALGWYAFKNKLSFVALMDFIAPVVPIGLAAGRIGNFINGELWGRVTDVPWAMIFPRSGSMPRHPSQLYEFMLEGIVLFILLWLFSKQIRPRGAVSGMFLVFYGLFRFSLEFFREPDQQIGFVAFGWLTKGQLLSLPMLIAGIVLLLWAYRRKKTCALI